MKIRSAYWLGMKYRTASNLTNGHPQPHILRIDQTQNNFSTLVPSATGQSSGGSRSATVQSRAATKLGIQLIFPHLVLLPVGYIHLISNGLKDDLYGKEAKCIMYKNGLR